MNVITKAKHYAQQKHKGVLDDAGKPFINHPKQVFNILSQVTDDESLLAAAWLHDVIEDTPTSKAELEGEFGSEIADLVHEVTHEGIKDSYGYYFPRLHSRKAILLKFADRLSNLSRMEAWDDKRISQYLNKSKFWK